MIYGIPPKNQSGKDICAYWDNFLTDEYINEILAFPDWINLAPAVVGGQATDPSASNLDTDIRKSEVSWLQYEDRTADLWKTLSNVIAEVNSTFFHFDLTGMYEPIQMSVYSASEQSQGHYSWHTDMSMSDEHVPRKLSMSLLLSDPTEYDGGELQIKATSDEEITLEPKKGRAWFFPSWALHRVAPVTRGVRRSLVVWVGGPPFK